jgi:hypothetical protein
VYRMVSLISRVRAAFVFDVALLMVVILPSGPPRGHEPGPNHKDQPQAFAMASAAASPERTQAAMPTPS